MRVVHIVNQNTRVCGYSRRTYEIVQAQRAAGIDAAVLDITAGRFALAEFLGVEARVFEVSGMARRPIQRLVMRELMMASCLVDGLERELLHLRPTILHAHTPWSCALAASIISARHGLPWLYEVRGLQEESAIVNRLHPPKSSWYEVWRAMEDWARRAAPAVLAISPALVEDARRRGAHQVYLTPNAVDIQRFEARIRPARSSPVVGYVGSMTPLEGVEALVESFSALAERVPDVRCRIIGDGTSRPQIEQLAQALPGIEVLGPIAPEAVPGAFHDLDCLAITRPDTLVTRTVTPLKPLEALACGTPVVSSDLAALRYVGEAGTLFYPAGDRARFVDAVESAFADRVELGTAGRGWVEGARTWAHVVRTQREAYGACA